MRENDIIRQIRSSQPPLPEGFETRRDALLLKLIQEEETVMKKKLTLSLALAIVLIVIMIGAAVAAGLGVFGQLAENQHDKEKMEKLETLSTSYQKSVTLKAEGNFPETTFTLEQGYYDGESLYISYAITGKNNEGKLLDGKPDEAALKGYEDQGRPEDVAFGLKQSLGDAFWSQVESRIEKDGHAYFQVFSQYLGDGAWLDKDTYINPTESDYKLGESGGYIGFTEFERPLPDAAKNKDSIDLYMLIYRQTASYYMTKDKVLGTGERSSSQLPMHITRAGEAPDILTGRGTFPRYTAEIRAKVSPVEIKADITLTNADEIRSAWEEPDFDKADETMDVLRSFQLYADGNPCRHTAYQASITGERLEIAMGFLRPQSYQELVMIPVYSQSGEHPEEAITLK